MYKIFASALLWASTSFMLQSNAFTTSIHLRYKTKGNVTAFQCQITVLMDPVKTYFMGIGFDGGYFGIQTKTEKERWINYSVWNGNKGAVPLLMDKGLNVIHRNFSHEGSGIQTHLVHHWETNVPQCLMVTVKRSDEGHAIFSGYIVINKKWTLMARIKRPGHAPYLTSLNSFLENFGVGNDKMRKARYSSIFYKVQGSDKWHPVNEAKTSNAPQTNSDDSWNHSVQYNGFIMEIDGKTGTKTANKTLKLNSKVDYRSVTDTVPPPGNINVEYCLDTFIVKKAGSVKEEVNKWFFWTGIEGTDSVVHVESYNVHSISDIQQNTIGKCYGSVMSFEQASNITLLVDGFQYDSLINDPLGKGSYNVIWDGNLANGLQKGQFDGGNDQYRYTVQYSLQFSTSSNPTNERENSEISVKDTPDQYEFAPEYKEKDTNSPL
jgi:hypothetical protein